MKRLLLVTLLVVVVPDSVECAYCYPGECWGNEVCEPCVCMREQDYKAGKCVYLGE